MHFNLYYLIILFPFVTSFCLILIFIYIYVACADNDPNNMENFLVINQQHSSDFYDLFIFLL